MTLVSCSSKSNNQSKIETKNDSIPKKIDITGFYQDRITPIIRKEPLELIVDSNPELSADSSTKENIKMAIKAIDGTNISFVSMHHANGDFIQCLGTHDQLTIELKDDGTKYRASNTEISDTTSTLINCSIGPFKVQKNQVFTKEDVIELFYYHLDSMNYPNQFYMHFLTTNQ